MATAQRIASGFPFAVYVNEVDSHERIAPGVYVNEEIASGATAKLRFNSSLNGLSASGPFFADRIE